MWSRALDVRLSEWCCSVSMVLVQNIEHSTLLVRIIRCNTHFSIIFLFSKNIYIEYMSLYTHTHIHCIYISITKQLEIMGYV